MRTFISFGLFLMLFPTGLEAQTVSSPADRPVQGVALENGAPSGAGAGAVAALGLPADMKWTGLTPAAKQGKDLTGLDAAQARAERSGESAFLKAPQLSGRRRGTTRDRVALMVLGLAVHAAVTWDAQSTNHFFSHCPSGYRPAEVDPIMRPFAGKASIYPMANLLFAAPLDLLLYRTRHGQKLSRRLTYGVASAWVGVELQQAVMNIRHEHMNSGR